MINKMMVIFLSSFSILSAWHIPGAGQAKSCSQFEIEGMTIVFSSGKKRFVPKGGSATIQCNDPAASLIGSSLLTCMGSNKWNDTVPYCDYVCEKFIIAGGNAEVTFDPKDYHRDFIPVEGTATVTCLDPADTLIGPSVLECIGGTLQWDVNDFPYCAKPCDTYTVENSTSITYTNKYNETKIKTTGTGNVTCRTKYELDPPDLSMCDNGEWTEIPKCTLGKEVCPFNHTMVITTYTSGKTVFAPLTKTVDSVANNGECVSLCSTNMHIDRCVASYYDGTRKLCHLMAFNPTFINHKRECDIQYNPPSGNTVYINYQFANYKKCFCSADKSEEHYAKHIEKWSCKENWSVAEELEEECND